MIRMTFALTAIILAACGHPGTAIPVAILAVIYAPRVEFTGVPK